MPPGYPYNIDPSYGPVSMISEENKLSAQQPTIKEERLKENPSPNDNTKNQMPVNTFFSFKTFQFPILSFYLIQWLFSYKCSKMCSEK